MTLTRSRAVWIVLGALTAAQVGIGTWRAGVMLREGTAAGVLPFVASGVVGEVILCGALVWLAWWWLPASGGGHSVAAWAVRFILLAGTLVLTHYAFAMATGGFARLVTPIALATLAIVGAWVRRWPASPPPDTASPAPDTRHPALFLAAAFWVY